MISNHIFTFLLCSMACACSTSQIGDDSQGHGQKDASPSIQAESDKRVLDANKLSASKGETSAIVNGMEKQSNRLKPLSEDQEKEIVELEKKGRLLIESK